jgi:hypothetical protein
MIEEKDLFQNSDRQGEIQSIEPILWVVDYLSFISGDMLFDISRYFWNRRPVVPAFGLSRYF